MVCPSKHSRSRTTQEPPIAPGDSTNQHNKPSQVTHPTNTKDSLNTIPNNTEELHPLIQEMLDQGGKNLDNNDNIGVMAAAPMIDDDNQPAPENLLSTEDSTGATNDIMGLWAHSGICKWKATIQCNAKPEHTFWTLSLSNPSNLNLFEGYFSHHLSKQQSFPKPTKTFPMVRHPSYMGNFYVGLVCGCYWGLLLVPRGVSSGQPSQLMHFLGPLLFWAFG